MASPPRPDSRQFPVDYGLLAQAAAALCAFPRLYWVLGGAASGKSTVCRALSSRFGIPIYDMDACIYGSYHSRFDPIRHPVNHAWSAASDGLAWLLEMTWEEFNAFNHAAVPEYLDLFVEDLADADAATPLLVDGGISAPAVLAQALPTSRIVCLPAPGLTSAQIWGEIGERAEMKDEVVRLPDPERSWQKFLEFDEQLTCTILDESHESAIPVGQRDASAGLEGLVDWSAATLGFQ